MDQWALSFRYGWTNDLPPELQQGGVEPAFERPEVRNWTSLELAKPVWEEEPNMNPEEEEREGSVEQVDTLNIEHSRVRFLQYQIE